MKYGLLFPSGVSFSELFLFAIYIHKSHLNDSDLFSWQFEDVTAIQPTFVGEKRQPPFQAPPL